MSRNQVNQPLILPHPGILLPQPGLTVFPYQQATNLVPTLPLISPPAVPSSPVAASPNSNSDGISRYSSASMIPQSTTSRTLSSNMKDFRIISWEELKKLFHEPGPDSRVESGLLSDGRAYAQKTARKENYFLFPSKSAYILYFIHYYFSCENLDRDQTFRRMMIESTAVSVDKLIQAPRLASIGTTPLDLQFAISNSNILCLVDLPDGNRGVKRIDGYPGNPLSTDTVCVSTTEIRREISIDKNPLIDQPPSPAFTEPHMSLERNFVSTSIGELPAYLGLNDPLVSNDNISCNNSSEFNAALLSSPFAGPPYAISSSSSQKNSRQVSPGNYSSSSALESPAVNVSSFQSSSEIPFSVQSPIPTQGLILPYGGTYSVPLQSVSSTFPQQVFVARSPRSAYPISFDAALSAFLTFSGGNVGQAFANNMTGNSTIHSPPNLHFFCPQISNASHVNSSQQLNAYRNLLTAAQSSSNPAMNSQNQNANLQQEAFSTLANLTQFYQQQQSLPRATASFQPGQQIFPHQINLQASRRNTPPPNQSSYYQLAANQSMHACTPQHSQPQFYTALPVTYAPGFSFAAPTVEGRYSGFRGQPPLQPYLQDSVMPHVWNSSETLAAATTGINLQYAAPSHLSALVGGLPMAFDNLSLNCARNPAMWQQTNSPFSPVSIKTSSFDSQAAVIPPSVSVSVPASNPTEVHPCAVDDPSIVAVTDSGDAAPNASCGMNLHEKEVSMDVPVVKNSQFHASKNVERKHNWQSKFQLPHNSVLISNMPIPSSPIPFFPTASKGRPQSALGLPASDLLDESILKNKEIRLVNDLGISLHSNPD